MRRVRDGEGQREEAGKQGGEGKCASEAEWVSERVSDSDREKLCVCERERRGGGWKGGDRYMNRQTDTDRQTDR